MGLGQARLASVVLAAATCAAAAPLAAEGEAVCATAGSCNASDSSGSGAAELDAGRAASPSRLHYWPHPRGRPGLYGASPHVGPTNLSNSLKWSWHHPADRHHTIIVGPPLIDDDSSIYLAAEDGIRKFEFWGDKPTWFYKPYGPVSTSPSLGDAALFGSTQNGYLFSVNMSDGQQIWATKVSDSIGKDTSFVAAHAGVVVGGAVAYGGVGNRKVVALNASTGKLLWKFQPDTPTWNFAPVFPEDGSMVFQDYDGGVYRLSLNGTLMWRAGRTGGATWTDGGVTLGPDRSTLLAVSNAGHMDSHHAETPGGIAAFRLSDGAVLWSQSLPRPTGTIPVLAELAPGAGLSVVVPIGAQALNPGLMDLPYEIPDLVKWLIHKVSLWLGDSQQMLWRNPPLPTEVWAFDAESFKPRWRFDMPPYLRRACAGDEEGLLTRASLGLRPACHAGAWSSPTVDAQGTVYIGHISGSFMALRDVNGDGKLQGDDEVSTFQAHAGFLGPGASVAPGMVAIASCDELFVFRA